MCSDRVITAMVVTLAIISLYACTAETPCTTNRWFGPNCQYQCHCAGSGTCDKHDGSCSFGCHQDWFGPACQYVRVSFTTSGGESWLTDNDDTTCNTGNTQSVSVTLDTSIPLTWVRVVVRDADNWLKLNHFHLDQIQLSYQLSGSSTPLTCPGLRKAKVDDLTLDIECFTTEPVSGVTLSGSGVTGLCSLYISGGRNVALKQTAQQSSRYSPPDAPHGHYAENAVDGVLPGDTVESARSTCTHTDAFTQDPGWWTVTFSQAVDVTRFLIYNRDDTNCGQGCKDRLAGFTLTAQADPSTATLYSYTDPGGPGQASYTVVPSPRISFPVSLVRFDTAHSSKILTLCEVFVFGETDCPAGQFGLRCERQCNCADQGSCFVHSGGCPSGCATGYSGEDCSECPPGLYGDQCDQSCSATCGGDNSCDRNSGACSQGCDPGYLGTTCETECGPGTYGAGCSERCSVNCAGPDNACNYVTGTCDVGCDAGHWGNTCLLSCSNECGGLQKTCSRAAGACDLCPPRYYGTFCTDLCSNNCAGSGNECDQLSGSCTAGCDPGYYGDKCLNTCSSKCGGSDKACDRDTGACQSCSSGFTGVGCDHECPSGSYGKECAETCSDHCAGDQNSCDHVNGTCDLGCEPGYQGSSCTQICPRGRYGPDCNQSCSVLCAGPDRPCHPVDGSCYLGCVHGDKISNCKSAALTCDESDDSGVKTWAIVATILASVAGSAFIVAAVAIGILVRRNDKLSRDRPSTSADRGNNGEAETTSQGDEGRQKPVQQSTAENERPNHYYESTESNPGDVHLYETSFDHYDRPENLLKESADYENPLPGNDKDLNQDTKKTEQDHAASKSVDGAPYSN